MLKAAIGDLALEYLFRLWGYCQDSRAGGKLGKVDAVFVETVCGWTGEKGKLFTALTVQLVPGKKPWIDTLTDGTLIAHEWGKTNKGLKSSRKNGALGGRPRGSKNKPKPQPTENPQVSSGQPTGKPQHNPQGGGMEGSGGDGNHFREVSETHDGPTLAQVIEWGKMDGIPEEKCRAFYTHYAGLGWMYGNTRMRHPRHWLSKWRDDRSRSLTPSDIRKKNGESVFEKKTRKENLAEYLRNHPANPESNFSGAPTPEEKSDFEARKKEYDQLTRELATGGKP
jgi:hypothetical protein